MRSSFDQRIVPHEVLAVVRACQERVSCVLGGGAALSGRVSGRHREGCSGPVSGWSPLGRSGTYEVAHVDLIRGAVGVRDCKNGGQKATSDAPFGITVWGLDKYASYAYPAGGNATALNAVVVPAAPR